MRSHFIPDLVNLEEIDGYNRKPYLMHLAWLVVNHIGTLPSGQLGEDPHPEAGGNLEQDQIGLGP